MTCLARHPSAARTPRAAPRDSPRPRAIAAGRRARPSPALAPASHRRPATSPATGRWTAKSPLHVLAVAPAARLHRTACRCCTKTACCASRRGAPGDPLRRPTATAFPNPTSRRLRAAAGLERWRSWSRRWSRSTRAATASAWAAAATIAASHSAATAGAAAAGRRRVRRAASRHRCRRSPGTCRSMRCAREADTHLLRIAGACPMSPARAATG